MQYSLNITGMESRTCAEKVRLALVKVAGVIEVQVCHISGQASVKHRDVEIEIISKTLENHGFSVSILTDSFGWKDKNIWARSAKNTTWCLLGCSIGEFGTLIYYSLSEITSGIPLFSPLWYFYAILPLINGLITSIILETAILMQKQMDFSNALSTALGMSFISMLVMEITMEITDLIFTKGTLQMDYRVIPLMLILGFLAPWPYNYWRLKKHGHSCH